MEFKVKSRHFRKGDMKLKCLAMIASVYWRSNEESVEGEKPREAVMESRGTAPPSKSRAERVEGQILNATFQLDGANRCPASHQNTRVILLASFEIIFQSESNY
jgi:hypothetical protein